jgi:hypothetical protein
MTATLLPLRPTDIEPTMGLRRLHDAIYGGEVLCLRQSQPVLDLVAFTRRRLVEAFAGIEPDLSHAVLSHDQQVARYGDIQRRFSACEQTRSLWAAVFGHLGFDPATIFHDRLYLRFQPHQEADRAYPRTRFTSTVAFHRDTWGSNLYAQVNWWAPVWPITAGRTVAIYPGLWRRPLANTTRSFDLAALLERSRTGGRTALSADDMIPHLADDVRDAPAFPVLIEPGDILLFSGAHAHAGVPNCTGRTRISLETRTLWLDDVRAGRCAPNIDGEAAWMAPGWFRRLADGERLSGVLGVDHLAAYDGHGRAVPGRTRGGGTTPTR